MDEENALQKDSKSHFVKDANLFCRKHQLRLTLKGLYLCNINEHPEYLQPIITQYFIDNKSEIWLLFLIAHSKR